MRGAKAVAARAGDFAAPDCLPRRRARDRGGIQQPQRVAPRGAGAGQMADRRREQRRCGAQPLVVAGLARQVAEQMPQPAVGEPDPAMLAVESQQYLRHRQAGQFRICQPGPLAPAPAGRGHMIVDLHVQCGQEGVQVCCHERSWMPSSHFMIKPTRRTGPNQESLI